MTISVQDDRAQLDAILAEQAALMRTAVTVGIHGDAPAYVTGDKDQPPISMQDIALVHEYGSEDGRIPERSFLRSGIAAREDELLGLLGGVADKVTTGRLTAEQAGEQVGLTVQAGIQQRIQQGEIKPELSPVTIAQRTNESDTPLFDTGQLVQSITFVADQSDPEGR